MMDYKQAVKELFFWQRDAGGTNFHVHLYSLIAKADEENLACLRRGFPSEVQAYQDWMAYPTPASFFAEFGLR